MSTTPGVVPEDPQVETVQDAGGATQVERDAAFFPLPDRGFAGQIYNNFFNARAEAAPLTALKQLIGDNNLYAASITPLGSHLCRVLPEGALRGKWEYVDAEGDALEPRLEKILKETEQKWHIKQNTIEIAKLALTFGRALAFVDVGGVPSIRVDYPRNGE